MLRFTNERLQHRIKQHFSSFQEQILVIAGSLLFTVKRVQNLKIIALRPRVNDESFKVVLTSESVKGIKINVTIQVHLLPITFTR